jgi:hypothetical protein
MKWYMIATCMLLLLTNSTNSHGDLSSDKGKNPRIFLLTAKWRSVYT